MRRFWRPLSASLLLLLASTTVAQEILKGTDFAVQSDGTPDGKLERNGYIGTFIRVAAAGDVELTAKADGTSTDATLPSMAIAVADNLLRSEIGADGSAPHLKVRLPAGTYFVRVQLDNAALAGERSLAVENLALTGASYANENSDANALAAADTYIDNFRKGQTKLHIAGAPAGTQIHLKLTRHAFNFGAALSGYETSMHLDAHPAEGSDAARYQQILRDNFDLIVPGNAGKWAYNEKVRGTPTMAYIDRIREVAKENGQRVRMHSMLWDTEQQPQFVRDLLTKAAADDEAAKSDLRKAISDRIQYYVRDRAASYVEMDILNEAYHQPRYWKIFGAAGIADIFREAADALKNSGATTRLYVNEYNILQWSQTPPYGKDAKGGPDPFANWYREHVEQIRDAGGPVTGIGVQYYADVRPGIPQPHSAARINGVFQNLSVTGLPISLTEFGVNRLSQRPTPPTTQQTADAVEAGGKVIDEALRMSFGTPSVTTLICWGFWQGDVWDQAPLGALYDKQWNLTAAGRAFESRMNAWSTDVTLPVGADGTIDLAGFYGDYTATADGKHATFSLARGVGDGNVQLVAP